MLTIITGAPGCGKTTLAGYLAREVDRGVHIPADLFYSFIGQRIPPNLPEADGQNHTVIAAVLKAALTYSAAGCDVFLDGIFGPWFVEFMAGEIGGQEQQVDYVLVDIPLDQSITRVHGRSDQPVDESVIRQMHREFQAGLGPWREHVLDAEGKTVEDLAQELLAGRKKGKYRLDLDRLQGGKVK